METNKKIDYPYLPEGRKILYIPESNQYMTIAKEFSKKYRSNLAQPSAVILVKNNDIIGMGSIGNNPFHIEGCIRVKLNMPTGQGYDLCEGCDSKFHSEPSAINDAKEKNNNTQGSDAYLWGHWWCCEPCWNAMIDAGIKDVYLLENSEILFNKNNPDNILGHQFD